MSRLEWGHNELIRMYWQSACTPWGYISDSSTPLWPGWCHSFLLVWIFQPLAKYMTIVWSQNPLLYIIYPSQWVKVSTQSFWDSPQSVGEAVTLVHHSTYSMYISCLCPSLERCHPGRKPQDTYIRYSYRLGLENQICHIHLSSKDFGWEMSTVQFAIIKRLL